MEQVHYTLPEVATILGTDVATIQGYIAEARLRTTTVNGQQVVLAEAFVALVEDLLKLVEEHPDQILLANQAWEWPPSPETSQAGVNMVRKLFRDLIPHIRDGSAKTWPGW